MDGERIGRELARAAERTQEWDRMRNGGNLGMAFIASAIERLAEAHGKHADALAKLAEAMEKASGTEAMEEPKSNTCNLCGHVCVTIGNVLRCAVCGEERDKDANDSQRDSQQAR
jgi:rubrerythrin